MRLFMFRGEVPNFGDDLNEMLWPQLLPGFLDEDESSLFLGIGSILFADSHFNPTSRKIVCGSGYGGYTAPPTLDARWEVHFVRGPRTAQTLNLDPALAIGDSGILVRALDLPRPAKKHKISFIPHWQSLQRSDWRRVAAAAGMHFIDPTGTPAEVMQELLASERVLCEAMHGAIVSDALRVPWTPLLPLDPVNRVKWDDWAGALGMELQPRALRPASLFEWLHVRYAKQENWNQRLWRLRGKLDRLAPAGFIAYAAAGLRNAARVEPSLSTDAAIGRATERMLECVDRIRRGRPPGG